MKSLFTSVVLNFNVDIRVDTWKPTGVKIRYIQPDIFIKVNLKIFIVKVVIKSLGIIGAVEIKKSFQKK